MKLKVIPNTTHFCGSTCQKIRVLASIDVSQYLAAIDEHVCTELKSR